MAAVIIFLLFFLLIGGIGIVGSIFWIWMLVNAAQNKALSENERLTWVLIIVFTHFIGALIYFFAARKPRQVFYQQQYMPPFQQQGYPPQPNYPPQQGYPPQQAYPYQPPAQQSSWNQQYQQGYQGYQATPGNAYPEQKGDPLPSPERYEYPRASYPEQSQE